MFSEDYYSLDRFDLCPCTSPRTQPQRLLQGHFNRMGIGNRLARQEMCFDMFIYTPYFSVFSPSKSSKLKLFHCWSFSQGEFNLLDNVIDYNLTANSIFGGGIYQLTIAVNRLVSLLHYEIPYQGWLKPFWGPKQVPTPQMRTGKGINKIIK